MSLGKKIASYLLKLFVALFKCALLFALYIILIVIAENYHTNPLVSTAIANSVFCVFGGIYYLFRGRTTPNEYKIPLSKEEFRSLHIYFLYVWYVTQATFSWLYHLYGDPSFDDYNEAMTSAGNFYMVLAVLSAPVFEELMFRGIFFHWLNKVGTFTAVLFSTLFFGLIHGTVLHMYSTAVLGAMFAYIIYYTGRLDYVIGYHALNNLLAIFCSWMILLYDFPLTTPILVVANILIPIWGARLITIRKDNCRKHHLSRPITL